jgi:hypothetical protein
MYFGSSCKVPVITARVQWNLNFSDSFHENPSSGSRVLPWGRTDGRTDIGADRHDRHLVHAMLVLQTNQHKIHGTYNIKIHTRKLIVAFRNLANAPDNQSRTDLGSIINPVYWVTKHQGCQSIWNFMSILEVGNQYRSFCQFKKTASCSKTYLTSTLNAKFWRHLYHNLSYTNSHCIVKSSHHLRPFFRH